ncbi:uncharacterized protein LOC126766781 isoform X1 [Bactrocera neohumeralis]|uniref:uncharacterized protein LOC126764208 isoform X1 n=1 Tax=Bactrocera neohumeralis TaxID=98809 RepID=UPI00216674AB|nr:uncharacterized protein LOC126764208 isoform X1 [Bactrocera neohumeralis]XP_050340451.1 uncharacterized protein LOC126766781 isoform X1 [Bactrocera neohumeralis]
MVLCRQNIVWFSLMTLLIAFHVAAEYDNTPQPSEEDNSSSEATIEDSNESRNKRSIEATNVDNNSKGGDGKSMARAGIPGLPDPATILKVAEILQALGEKVVPILVEGNSVANLVAERLDKNYAFLKDLKSQIDSLTYQTKSM